MKSCEFWTITFLAMTITQGSYARPDTVGAPSSGVELGLGWDTQSAATTNARCVEFAPIQETGQTINMHISDVSDSSEVSKSMNVSASMSIRSAFGSGSAQSEFASNSKVSSNSNSILIRATVNNGVVFAGPPKPSDKARYAFPGSGEVAREYQPWWNIWTDEKLPKHIALTEEAKNILGKGGKREMREFERMCGDSFVSAIYSGAEMLAIMSFKASSKDEMKTTKSSVKAAISAWGVSGEGTASAGGSSQVKQGSTSIEIDYTQIGGAGGIIPTSKDEFFQKLHELPLEALRGPQFHTMDVTPYTDLPDWPQKMNLDSEDDPLDVKLTNYYWTLNSINLMIEELMAEAKKDTDTGRLETVQDKITDYRRAIHGVLKEAYELMDGNSHKAISKKWFGKDKKDDAEEQLDIKMKALLAELQRFSLNTENPNLIKLYLPIPEQTNATEQKNVVEFYLEKQAKRTCSSNPTSSECLTNADLKKLASCVPKNDEWLVMNDECPYISSAQ